MKKTLLGILALGLVCCTPQRQENLHITITTDDTTERKMSISPMDDGEGFIELAIEEGAYTAIIPSSKTGFYSLVSVKGDAQYIMPYYVPVTKSKSTSKITFGERGSLSLSGSRDNRALAAYTAAYAANSRALWGLSKGDTEAARALIEAFATKADSIIAKHRCSDQVAEYIQIWAYTIACDSYNSLPRIVGMPANELPYSREDLLAAPHTMLNTPTAALFSSTPHIVYAGIPYKNNLDSALLYVEQHYTEPTLIQKVNDNIASRYVSRYNYNNEFDRGLERLQIATDRYGLDHHHIADFEKHRATVPGQPFPGGIVLKDPEGNMVDFSTFHGKYVYIDMWASWCVPCLREVPELQKLEKTLKNKKVEFVSISIDASEDSWKKKLKEKDMHGNQFWNPDGTLGKALNVKGIPFFVIYDPDGNLYMHGAPRPSQGPGLVELLERLK